MQEFKKPVLEVLRQPIEDLQVTISRAKTTLTYPADFMLVAAMNPCPCGYLGDSSGRCRCSPDQVSRYRARVSGPLLDRIDLHVEVDAELTVREGHAIAHRVKDVLLHGEPAVLDAEIHVEPHEEHAS